MHSPILTDVSKRLTLVSTGGANDRARCRARCDCALAIKSIFSAERRRARDSSSSTLRSPQV